MKSLAIISFLLFISNAYSVCSSPIARTNLGNVVLTATRYNTDLNVAYTRANELPGDCITSESVTTTQIDDGTIVNADVSASAAIARSKLGASNYTISTSSGSFSTSSTVAVDVTNLSVTITTTGNPVELFLIGNDAAQSTYIGNSHVTATSLFLSIKALRGVTQIGLYDLDFLGASGTIGGNIPPGAVRFFDVPAAGTYTYKIQTYVGNASDVGAFNNVKLVAREI